MLIIKKDGQDLKISNTSSDVLFCDNYCSKKFCKKDKKCISFYTKLFEQHDSGFYLCPYGYSAYVSSKNKELIFSSIYCELSNIKLLKNRDNYEKIKIKRLSYKSDDLKLKLDLYSMYNFYANISNSICHDLNNALNQLMAMIDETVKNQNISKFIQFYDEIARKVEDLSHYSIINLIELSIEYSPWVIKNKIEDLLSYILFCCQSADKAIKKIDVEEDSISYLLLSGFTLLRTLLMQNLVFEETFNFKEEMYCFSLHKMIKKIVLLCKRNALLKNVSFPSFEGLSYSKIYSYPDKVFTIIFTIIDNAVKYCPENDIIQIFFKEIDSKIELQVLNKTSNLDDYDLEHLHEKGYRGKNKTLKGHGLGLSVVERLCEECGINHRANFNNGYFTYTLQFSNIEKE